MIIDKMYARVQLCISHEKMVADYKRSIKYISLTITCCSFWSNSRSKHAAAGGRLFYFAERHPSGLPAPLYRRVQSSVLQSDVTVVGIVVCAVLLAVLLGVAVVQRLYWRHLPKYNMAATEESPAHCAHSSSAHSSQPSSPGPHVQVDMDIPLTGEYFITTELHTTQIITNCTLPR